MDSLGWAVYDMPGRRGLAERRHSEVATFHQEGTSDVVGGNIGHTFSVKIWIDWHTPEGEVPENPRDQYEKNVSTVLGFFAHDDFWELGQQMPDGSMRYAMVRTVGDAPVLEEHPGSMHPVGRTTVVLHNPSGYWTDRKLPTTFTSTTIGSPVTVDTLLNPGGRGLVHDAVVRIFGPISSPRISSGSSFLHYTGTLGSAETLTIDCKRMRVTRGSTSVMRDCLYSGRGIFSIAYPYRVTVSGTATNSATNWRIEALPKHI